MPVNSFPQALQLILETIVGFPQNDERFALAVGIGLFLLLLTGKVLTATIGNCEKGLGVSGLAMLITVGAGLTGSALGLVLLREALTPGLELWIGAAGCGAAAVLLSGMVVSKLMLDIKLWAMFFALLFSYAIGYAGVFVSQVGVAIYEEGKRELDWEREKKRMEEDGIKFDEAGNPIREKSEPASK